MAFSKKNLRNSSPTGAGLLACAMALLNSQKKEPILDGYTNGEIHLSKKFRKA